MLLNQITPLILTYNEAPNLDRTLQQLTWAKRIVVIDSQSDDETLEILSTYPQVEVFQRQFDTHAFQWNYGLQQVESEWVLSLDADYVVSQKLIHEIATLTENSTVNGYWLKFKYCVFGKPLRGSILPPRQALFRRKQAVYIDDGHTQLLQVQGQSAELVYPIYHDDRKPLKRWLWAQERYMTLEVKKLLTGEPSELSWSDRIRKQKVLAPFIILIYCLILKQGIFDGWRGWYYAFQRVLAEVLLSLRLMEAESKLQEDQKRKHPSTISCS